MIFFMRIICSTHQKKQFAFIFKLEFPVSKQIIFTEFLNKGTDLKQSLQTYMFPHLNGEFRHE